MSPNRVRVKLAGVAYAGSWEPQVEAAISAQSYKPDS